LSARPPGSQTAETDDDLVMGLVEQALSQPLNDREPYLRNACAGDASLFETVWAYVNWDERMRDFLLEPLLAAPEEPMLEPGRVLEDRFRIVREVGGGGMGVVYEAWDEKLGRRIAVKCARTGFHNRLSPEVRHASEINHPNICKTWEIHTASGPQGDFDFLTMEFIEGKTLAETLRDGPLPKKEAASIAAQLCAGLAEAHRHQVIHGDLKTNNVLLAREPEGTRAVITDFGLARGWLTQAPAGMSGEPAGTLSYMAPELFKNERPSAASDIYALGVILHELASGRTPFDGVTPLQNGIARRPAGLKHPWGRIIARCLESDPRLRYANASQIAAALVPFAWFRWSAIAAAVAAAAVGGAFAYRTAGVSHETVRLAMIPFATDPASRSLSDGLLQDTAEKLRHVKDDHTKLTVIPLRDISQNKADAPENAARRVGATHILGGTLRRSDGLLNIHAALTDAQSGLKLKEWDAEYRAQALGNLPVALAGMVTGALRLRPLTVSATVNAAAYPDFAAAIGLLRRDSGVDAALPMLERAVAADPDSPLTYARLAEALARKYRLSGVPEWLDRANASLHEAEQRNPDLASVWLISGRIHEYEGFYEEAEADLKRALDIDSRDGDVWRRLGQVYQEDYHFAKAAMAFWKAVDLQPGYFGNFQNLCDLYTEQANYAEAIQQCRKTVQLASDSSDAHFALAIPYFESGAYAQSESEFKRAIELDPMSAKAIYGRAFALTSQGRLMEAFPLFFRAIETGPASHMLYLDLGTAYRLAGLPAKARRAYRDGLDLAENWLQRNPRDAIAKAQLAYLCAQLNERNRAISEAIQSHQLAADSVEADWWLIMTWDSLRDRKEEFALLQQVPDSVLSRINREADLADLRRSSRFKQVMQSRHIQ
jgi:eukaryotic-like serine/threonine-protein kinase